MNIQFNKKKLSSSYSGEEVAVSSKISIFYKPFILKGFSAILFFALVLAPVSRAHAGFFSSIGQFLGVGAQAAEEIELDTYSNSQTMHLMESSLSTELKSSENSIDVTIVDEQALESKSGPLGTEASVNNFFPSDTKIDVYMVKKGDTLDSIAKVNKVSKAAIIYANNDMSRSELTKVGQVLVIAPLKGVMYTVKKGETAKTIATRYGISVGDITEYNVLAKASDLKAGDSIILVGLDSASVSKADKAEKEKKNKQTIEKNTPPVVQPKITKPDPELTNPESNDKQEPTIPSGKSSYIWPFPAGAGSISQGLHDGNGVDLRAPKGTEIYAVKDGTVLIADANGWNGGYGLYVVVNFNDGSQALYGHMSKVKAVAGQVVKQGDLLGEVGSTGKSTGNHLHLEIRGGFKNPFGVLRVGKTSADFYNLYK
jgi:murein DD-endopeptidase MepM/ murein hydrolase activator NlpD